MRWVERQNNPGFIPDFAKMLPQQQREDRTLFRGNVAVAPRCIALVLRDVGWPRKDKSEVCRHHVHDVHSHACHGSGSNNCLHHSDKAPKAVFSAFIDENRCGSVSTSLDECIQRIKFIGNIEPWTLLLSGDEADLERLRVAWARRNLRPPSGFVIHGLGDINGIEMQTIPQTQFIPLPDAICGVISELYTSGVKATREHIKDRLLESFRGMHTPTEAMISESLLILAREKKIGLSGDTYQVMVAEVPAIPVIIDPVYASINDEDINTSTCPHYSQKTSPSSSSSQPVTNHSSNFRRSESVQLPKNKDVKLIQKTNFARSSSMRYGEGDGKAIANEIGAKTRANIQLKEKGEKLSLLSRIFGKNKKKREVTQEQPEYSTFSGQFPPPEWQCYDNQQQRSMAQEISKSQTWHSFQPPKKEYGLIDCRPLYMDPSAPPEHIPMNGQTLKRNSHVRIYDTPNRLTNTPEKHVVSPARTDSHRSAETYSSIPKDKHRSHRRKKRHHSDKHSGHQYQNVSSQIQVQADVHHQGSPLPPPYSLYGSDISIEYKGRLPAKNTLYALSKDSGVNCIGKKQSHGPSSTDRAKYYKRRSCPPMSSTAVLEESCGHEAGKSMVQGSDKDNQSDREKPRKSCSCEGKCIGHEGRILSDSGINSARNTDISDAKNTDRSSDKHLQGSDSHRKKYTELVKNRSCELERISDNVSVNTSHERLPDTPSSMKCDKLLTSSERYPSYGTVIEVVKEDHGNSVQCTHVHLVEKRPHAKEEDVENRDNLPECDMQEHSCYRNSKHLLCPHHAHQHYIDAQQHGHVHNNNNNNTIISGHTCWIHAQSPRVDNAPHGHPDKRASCGHVPYYETNLDDEPVNLRLSYNSLTQAQMETLSSDAQRLGFIGDYKVVGFV